MNHKIAKANKLGEEYKISTRSLLGRKKPNPKEAASSSEGTEWGSRPLGSRA